MTQALINLVGATCVLTLLVAIWTVLDRVVAPLLLCARRRRLAARLADDPDALDALAARYSDKPDGPRALALRVLRLLPWILAYAAISSFGSLLWQGAA